MIGRGTGQAWGSGWISGVVAVTAGALGLGGVSCLLFPDWLTTPDMRERYPMDVIRGLVHAMLVIGFGMGVLSALLRRRKLLGLTGAGLSTLGTLLGGAEVPIDGPVSSTRALGLDWFLLNLLMLALLFVPLERLFPRRPEQPVFRAGWTTDLTHFAMSHLLVQLTVVLTLAPAAVFFHWAARPWIQAQVAGQPIVLQFLEVLLVADLTQYAVHRAFHRVPWLWRFHAVHHSSQTMDWLAGSRLHLLDIVVTRGLTFVPLYVLGFSATAIYAYLVFVSFHAVFIHANLRFDLRALDWLLVTPRFHHWHHAAHPEAIDRNFAIHLPWIDRLFGTAHLPPAWPERYGIDGAEVPEGYVRQLTWPFRRTAAAALVALATAATAHSQDFATVKGPHTVLVTVDDLPIPSRQLHPDGAGRARVTADLLSVLAKHEIQAVGFVVWRNVGDAADEKLLERWLEAGHELGNHTNGHLDFTRTETEEWIADAEKGRATLAGFLAARGRRLRFFRFPYLREGDTLDKLRRARVAEAVGAAQRAGDDRQPGLVLREALGRGAAGG